MTDPDTDSVGAAREAFLAVYKADLEAERIRTLQEYQDQFPGHEESIADGAVSASIGLRDPLPSFSGLNVGNTITLNTGEVGDEGAFSPAANFFASVPGGLSGYIFCDAFRDEHFLDGVEQFAGGSILTQGTRA